MASIESRCFGHSVFRSDHCCLEHPCFEGGSQQKKKKKKKKNALIAIFLVQLAPVTPENYVLISRSTNPATLKLELGRAVIAQISTAAPINDLSFSSDGSKLAVGSSDGYLRLYSLESGAQLHEFQPHEGAPVYAAQLFAPPKSLNPASGFDNLLLTGGRGNDQLKLWDTQSWSLLQEITFSPASEDESSLSGFAKKQKKKNKKKTPPPIAKFSSECFTFCCAKLV